MNQKHIDRQEGSSLFGADAAAYDAARPGYPDWVFEALTAAGALHEGAATLEIGSGTGMATRHLVAAGARPLTLVEPDERFNALLRIVAPLPSCTLISERFEDVLLPDANYDLVVAASCFHWVRPDVGLPKVSRILKEGGTAALMWNMFQDQDKDDPFHEATQGVLSEHAVSPGNPPGKLPFALDRNARETDARAAGFTSVRFEESRWSLMLDAEQVGALYATFGHIQRLDAQAKAAVINQLKAIANDQFGGRVVRNMTTCLYLLRA